MTEFPQKLAIIGLGYVGLPLAAEFGRFFETVGFDIDTRRIEELRQGHDRTLELSQDEIAASTFLSFSSDETDLRDCTVYIVTVPTPVNKGNQPDLGPLASASEFVGRLLKGGDLVVYESTVYPGATEEVCVPILERASGLSFNQDFDVGYSPERINPGDQAHRLPTIVKVTSGSNPTAADRVDGLYAKIIVAGTHKASSIRVAEAAKVIENTQRDVNIALINELSLIFERVGISTSEVLEAAGTKWNFLNFKPGLVGGHCIGVDPYYLTYKAQELGYHPEMVLAGRRINDKMGEHIASRLAKMMSAKYIPIGGSTVLVMGLTFKENCPDLRNSRVIDIINGLKEMNVNVVVHDPWANPDDVNAEYGILPINEPEKGQYDGIVLAVAHDEFLKMGAAGIKCLANRPDAPVFDVKSLFPNEDGFASL